MIDKTPSTLPNVVTADWEAVREVRDRVENKQLRSLSIKEAFKQFSELVEFAEKLPPWGNLEKLHWFDIEQLVRWKRKIDSLGQAGE